LLEDNAAFCNDFFRFLLVRDPVGGNFPGKSIFVSAMSKGLVRQDEHNGQADMYDPFAV
jgi:hypothetical protein